MDNPVQSESTNISNKQTRAKRKIKELDPESDDDSKGKISDSEKVDLFNALIANGSSDVHQLQKYVPGRSEETVRQFLYIYKRYARYTLSDGQETKAPIDKWLDFLTSENVITERQKLFDMSRALKYISLFEPDLSDTECNLSDCYKLLSDCMRGEAPKHLNPVTSLQLYRQFQQLIKVYKSQNYDKEHTYLKNYKKKIQCYSGKRKAVKNTEEPRISNPLQIPDSLLELKK